MRAYLILADLVAVVHGIYVLFVIIGLTLILAGLVRKWEWVRGFWFRVGHLFAILIVCAQSLAGIPCPLTVLENRLREMVGAASYSHGFVGYWVDWLIFYNLPPSVFSAAYATLGCVIVALFVIAPPRWPCRDKLALTKRQ